MIKTALICGISGQDGSYLAKFLLDKGYEVHGTSRDAQISDFNKLKKLSIKDQVKLHSMALNDFRSVLQVLKDVQPLEIYNLAGQSSVALSFEQPVETLESISMGTLNLLEAIRFIGIPTKIYSAGSSECFGNTPEESANEDTPFMPRSPYAVAKATAHWEVINYREAYNIFACTGILFNHESSLRPERFVTQKIVKSACRISLGSKEKLYLGNIDIARDWGWAPEYVEAMWLILQQKDPEDFVIATGKTNTLKDFIATVFNVLGLDWKEFVISDPSLLRPSDILVSSADPSKAKELLGWQASFFMEDVAEAMVNESLESLKE